ncbi:uncharacterized protein LOC142976659 [Anticarsia gemmatalis]|uniref:uncharacterized protein LOC142976659 n=1 Tax=Anticarsia gemmatalis TaxID=129554 RepID=UPI003F7665FD
MRVHCQGLGREMADFAAMLNLNQGNQNCEEKMELVKMFVEYLEADNRGHKHKMHKHGHHGMHGRYGKHGHSKHHGRFGSFGRHGHHGHLGPHHHGHHGPHHHGHHGPHHHGHHGHHHHRHGFHGHNEKFRAQWTIDLTQDDREENTCVLETNRNPTSSHQENTTTSNEQQHSAVNMTNCKCSGFGRRPCRRSGRWMLCPYKRTNTTADNACQTEEPMTGDKETEENQEPENITSMVENINIENSE